MPDISGKYRRQYTLSLISLFLLSAATLLFEINLTRLFSVAQFYHFAFMIVSLALLGFGASGTYLAIIQKRGSSRSQTPLYSLALACATSMVASYLLINWLPFDSFSIAWDRKQLPILALHYLALATPFFFSGLLTGRLLSAYPQAVGKTYASNLTGSALGCTLAFFLPVLVGGEGVITASSTLALFACLVLLPVGAVSPLRKIHWLYLCLGLLLFAFNLSDLVLRVSGGNPHGILELQLSPYKSLSQVLHMPGTKLLARRWNAFSRVDLVSSPSIRTLPGLSYRYKGLPPEEEGLLVDGDNLSPLVGPAADQSYNAYLPAALAFLLRPQASTLVLEPRGGADILLARWGGASHITAVEPNPLVVEQAASVYRQPATETVVESGRSFLRRSVERFDIVLLSLTDSYHPIRSGAYSLGEDYRYTVESFRDAIAHLNPEGVLIVQRWLQMPPSEFLRTFAIAVTALEAAGLKPREQIVALRGYNLGILFVKATPFTGDELTKIRSFAAQLAYDLVFAPDISPDEVNRYNILGEPLYYQAFQDLLNSSPRSAFYSGYGVDVSPPSDDRPFFGHYFKWSQAGQVAAEFGRVWSPFGGAGYFVLLVLLALALILAAGLVLLPLALSRTETRGKNRPALFPAGVYFGMIGLGYLLVEIPLIQQFILFLNQPAYALTCVLFSLLLFSGLGSACSHRLDQRKSLLFLVLLTLITPVALPYLFQFTLGWSFALRLLTAALSLAPLGFLMGIPFASGLRLIQAELVPWAWGVNGALSVVSSIVAAILAISFGFHWVLIGGAFCYAVARSCVPYLSGKPGEITRASMAQS